MKKNFFMILSVLFLVAFTLPNASFAAIADGTYEVNYQVNKPGSNSASMANDYFLKPAKLIVNNGKMTMQLTIKNSSWVTEFKPPGGAKVISTNESAGQRTVQFPVSNANLVTIAMKIDIDDIDYHHAYSVDFVFNSSGLPEAKAEEPKEPVKPVKEETKQATPTKESPTSSSGSNTSSNKPAPSTEPQKTESSAEQATTEENTDDSTKTDEENASEMAQAENSEVVENPETSDELPLVAMILFIVAAIIFIRTKQTKTR